ncbi:MAG TPA: hypothetical protein ENF52_03670, partial [Chloroflexi bacterium]|nr:hypothetical protein [Chloroflexota bacterium]
MKRIWTSVGLIGVLVVLALVLGSGQSTAAPGSPNAPLVDLNEPTNTLRVYGMKGEHAQFPYREFDGPFNLVTEEAPPMDFLVWNPAYLYHLDPDSHGYPDVPDDGFGYFFQKIVADGDDANEKVFLKQWYDPDLAEPLGNVWEDTGNGVKAAHIVKEYTYILLDTDNNPTFGHPDPLKTAIAFPIADNDDGQIGLDSYDAIVGDADGANITFIRSTNLTETGFITKTLQDWKEDVWSVYDNKWITPTADLYIS